MTIEEARFEVATTTNLINLKGHTLILPCVSIGSVPQLAIDALLEPSNASRVFGQSPRLVSTLDHRFCVPFLGGTQRSGSSKEAQIVQGPLRVYTIEDAKVTVLQQRSPIIKSRRQDFVEALTNWITQKGFAEVIILTSLDAGLRTDAQMGHPFWYIDNGFGGKSEILEKMKSTLPNYQSPPSTSPSSTATTGLAMPSGGLAKAYLEATSANATKIPTQALMTFAAEGDNRSDALSMASLLLSVLNLNSNKTPASFTQPSDWSLFFGSQVNDSMFN